VTVSKPSVTFTDDFYRFEWKEEQIVAMIERLQEKRGTGLACELTIESTMPGESGVLYPGNNFNLTTSNTPLVNKLKARREIDWDALLDQMTGIAKKRYREGEPVVDLADVEVRDRARWLLPGFIEDTTRPTAVAAGGGTGKSTIGLAAAMTVATGVPFLGILPSRQCPVLYLDWEADPEIHAERVKALWRGAGRNGEPPPALFLYQRQVASMYESVSSIRRKVAENGVGFAVMDSAGFARGDDPNSAEATIRMYLAVRKLGIPVFVVDHVSKEALNNPSLLRSGIGSVFSLNSVCRLWVMKGEDSGPGMLSVSLSDEKRNNTARQRSLAYHVHIEDDGTEDQRPVSIRYDRASFSDLTPATQPGGQKWEMAAYLDRNGGMATDDDLAGALGITANAIRALLTRHKDMFMRHPATGQIVRLAEAGR